ncbi:hypothetical protein [Paenibacillus sp. JCM 10914]|uniref:hypothetical protein n=1 Tax=Paenibacillus sp. JCM 10914 TaxID=1236974 RepID=UPI00056C2B8E|nr:hypothetical protein [Paenibacillus sp. JCM 10914]
MAYRPQIADVTTAGSNDKEGLYEFIIHTADGTDIRVFYSRFPEWKLTALSRLGKVPCPVCRKDFICKCMEKFSHEFDQQMNDGQWLAKAVNN